MKRSELTFEKMFNMGWRNEHPCLTIEKIVDYIKSYKYPYLRCTMDDGLYSYDDHGMCSTYRVYYNIEYLEASINGTKWEKIAYRKVEKFRNCIYADQKGDLLC